MRLQIVMNSDARRALYRNGYLVGDKSRILFEDFEPAYCWMAKCMMDKIGSPPDGIDPWPMWAWYQRCGLGQVDALSDEYADQDLWVITFDVDRSSIVLSDFGAWHHVLNGWYLPDLSAADGGDHESEEFDRKLEEADVDWSERPYPAPFDEMVQASWSRIFNVTEKTSDIQATFWRLDLAQVISEEPCQGTLVEKDFELGGASEAQPQGF